MASSSQIRRQFIDFFAERCGHTAVPSSPVVPHDDPTLLFTNAGMNQFKDVFLGTGERPYTRAVDTQKCIRAGGKHNDLEDVGKDTYHHTFFEMLGNWSFGDYFKEEAIAWAWELLVDVWGIEPERLHATYFEGDPAEGLEPDNEARDLWGRFLPPDRIHPGSKKDNFWEMGDTGPCGPCSELHYDGTPDLSGASKVNQDDPDVIEIWNLVFIQFNRQQDGSLAQLPAKHVDTGMGFERVVRVLQGKHSNYDTDVFTPLFKAIQKATGARAYGGDLNDEVDIAYRVIADHIRTLTFALADGAHCGNEGRNYVLRRILRRAVRYGRQVLNVAEPFFYKLVPAVVDLMTEAFPELRQNPQAIADELREEEEGFGRTLDRGIALFETAAETAESEGTGTITGDDAFELYATYGFPVDLTELMASERGMSVDTARFEKRWAEHQAISRAKADGGVDVVPLLVEAVQQHKLPDTAFVGYEQTHCQANGVAIFDCSGEQAVRVESAGLGPTIALVTDHTPFYGEAGGQVGDAGQIRCDTGTIVIDDTQKLGGVYFHVGRVTEGTINADAAFKLEVDAARRTPIMGHHTLTHVMNHKLRSVLGDHVQQRGSLVDEQKTRFDFAHDKALTADEAQAVEEQVNAEIDRNLVVYDAQVPQDQALKINGLRAVFGEKYPPVVRVVSIGVPVDDLLANPANDAWTGYSIEFCGGTHAPSTGGTGPFSILTEEAVAKGVRRVTAVAGALAAEAREAAAAIDRDLSELECSDAAELDGPLAALTEQLGARPMPLVHRIRLRSRIDTLLKKLKKQRKAAGKEAQTQVVDEARKIADSSDGPIVVAEVQGADGGTLRAAMDVIRSRQPESAMMLAANAGGKLAFLAAVPEDLIAKGLKAGDWVRHVAQVAGGGGGGRPDMAQAGGKDPEKLADALEAARAFASDAIT